MSGVHQNGVVPGNVIDFRFSGEDVNDKENISNLFRDGSMVMFHRCRNHQEGMTFMRYVPGTLNFMHFDFTTSDMADVYWHITDNPVEGLVNVPPGVRWTRSDVFFAKATDLFYNKATKTVFLNCEEDWYQVDFTNVKHFVLNNHLSLTLHNLVTDEIKTLGEMRAWEVVDTDYEPFSEKWIGTPNLNSNYLDNFTDDNIFTPPTRGGKSQTILDMINAENASSSEKVESSEEEEEEEEEQEYAKYPDDIESGLEDDSDYDPAEDLEEGEVYEEDKVYEDQFDQEWLNNYYDEKRQDLDGNWYTRRQFYDYYGSDDAWDNLDPNTFQPYRYDEIDCDWHSKEEFFQQYGSDCIWDKFHSVMVVKRTMIWKTYQWATTLPKHLRKAFIKEMLETY